ncbi:MAG: hypothetical protein H6841_05170 [Planctomycetes bacterium]|nr:hypothetical protein [Planctomycetota bacterium]MCB9935006.1 hypothetical protein [Planctomycetota bacterium]
MDVADTIPALLKPLVGECVVVEGDSGAEAAMAAVREALYQPDGFRTQRVRPGRAIYEFRTREGEFIVKAFETRFMTRMSPLRFCASGREWKSIRMAQQRGIPTSRPMGLYSARSKPGGNYLVLERINGATELESYLERERERLRCDVKLLRGLVCGFAGFVAGLHKGGLVHRDLHLRNIMVRPPRAGKPAEFFVIDLADEDLAPGIPPEMLRRQNLAYLSLCFLDLPAVVRRRFLREYRKCMGDKGTERDVAHDIETQAAQKQFDLNTVRIATCGEASSAMARVQRPETLLLIYRKASNADLEQLEKPLAAAAPDGWADLLHQHFELRFGEGNVWKLKSPIDSTDEAATRRKLEALWGRLLELNAIHASAPSPLACLLRPPVMSIFARVPGQLTPLVKRRDHDSLDLFEVLGRQLARLHRFGCFFLPLDPELLSEGLSVASPRRGGRELVLTAPDHIFRGSPTLLGPQAVASLGRVGRTVLQFAGERQMKELVWSYARMLRLNLNDTNALLDEARRVPTGNTLVVTRGIERSRLEEGKR